jgi:hypothetical protein
MRVLFWVRQEILNLGREWACQAWSQEDNVGSDCRHPGEIDCGLDQGSSGEMRGIILKVRLTELIEVQEAN